MYQKKRNDVEYNFLLEFFSKIFCCTYVCYAPDGLFWLNLYVTNKKLGCKIFHTFQLQSNFSFQDKSLTSWIFQHIGPGRDKIYEILNKRLYPEKIRSFYYEKFGTFGELGCFARFSLVFRALFYLALAGFFSVLFYMDLMKDISFFFLIHHMSTKILVI